MTNNDHDDERLARLLRDAAELPREQAPHDDPWPFIKARIQAAQVIPIERMTTGTPRRRARPWRAAVAAAVLVVASSAITLLATRGNDTNAVNAPPEPAASASLVAIGARRQLVTDVCNNYESAASDLERVLRARRDRLSPTTVQVLEQSLRAIDQAISEARAALERDPVSQDMLDLLDSVYRQKLDLLRRANALPLRSS
jgi:hypothetical protein